MGGSNARSLPLTRWPASTNNPASEPMPVPQTPIRWMCTR